MLVHAAARFDQATLAEVEIETWRRVQAVNVEAAVLLAQAFAPGMAERGWGRIVHIVSDTIWRPPRPGLLPYVTSKAALVGLTRALALALGTDGITVNAVAPGLTRRRRPRQGIPRARRSKTSAAVRRCPRILVPDDVAGTVAFLCTDAGAALTGQTLNVDGGLIFH